MNSATIAGALDSVNYLINALYPIELLALFVFIYLIEGQAQDFIKASKLTSKSAPNPLG